MAQILKDGSVKGQGYAVDVVKKPETMIIPARELVQILAKVLCTIFFLLLFIGCLCPAGKFHLLFSIICFFTCILN
jgi:hypothetical protein